MERATDPRTVVLYHRDCPDGFGAAWAAWRSLGEDATYLPVAYGDPLPSDLPRGARVYCLDWTAPPEDLHAFLLKDPEARVVILDHHKTAQEAYEAHYFPLLNNPMLRTHFDLTQSGAMLAWCHFHPGTDPPAFIAYIQDRDLWQWKLENSREVSAWLHSYSMDFGVWSALAELLDRWPESVLLQGAAILRFMDRQVDRACDQATHVSLGTAQVPMVNTAHFMSEVGNRLLERFPEALFSLSYFDRADGRRQWSLRSRTAEERDVSQVARSFGGGGHPTAAGFRTDVRWLPPKATDAAAPVPPPAVQ